MTSTSRCAGPPVEPSEDIAEGAGWFTLAVLRGVDEFQDAGRAPQVTPRLEV